MEMPSESNDNKYPDINLSWLNDPEDSDASPSDLSNTEGAESSVDSAKDTRSFEFVKHVSSASEKLHSVIDAAIERADATNFENIGEATAELGSKYESVFDRLPSDFSVVHFIDDMENAANKPCVIYTFDSDEYHEILQLADEKYGIAPDRSGKPFSEYTAEHEGEHVDGYKLVNPDSRVLYVLDVVANREAEGSYSLNFQPAVNPIGTSITKLGFAAVRTYPTTPSEGDIEAIKLMGYENEIEVVERVIDYNKTGQYEGNPYPVPKWWPPQDSK